MAVRPDWPEVRISVMESIMKAKFEQNPVLKEKLLATSDIPLEYGNYCGDTYWGTVDGVGENHMGKVLMKVRDELRAEN